MYIMSCSEVMYQAYYPYLYQRAGASAHPVPRTGPFSSPFTAAHQYDRFNVQRLPDAHSLSQASSTSVGGPASLAASGLDVTGHSHALYLQGSAHSSGGSVSSAGGGSPTSPLRPQKEEDCSLHGRSSTEDPHGVDEDDSQEAGNSRAQYVSANCVVFTHYQGDAASVVDEHFSRALEKTTTHAKESSPMSSRNFPPSFWNSQHYAGASGSAHGHTSTSAADLYPEHYHPSDAWYQYSQHHYHHNMAAAAQYGSLLLPGGRLHHAPCKAMDWQHPGIDSPYSSYPTMSGLEAQVQDSSKDLYWF